MTLEAKNSVNEKYKNQDLDPSDYDSLQWRI